MATSAAGPPPTPTSLLGLPASWLLQLARTSALDNDRTTLLALFRTCTFFRDAVAQRRPSELSFTVPIAAERFQDEVNRLCTLARRSRNIALVVRGPTDQRRNPAPWNETEPHITHLLVCAMARLGGEQPLAGVKRIVLRVSACLLQRCSSRCAQSSILRGDVASCGPVVGAACRTWR